MPPAGPRAAVALPHRLWMIAPALLMPSFIPFTFASSTCNPGLLLWETVAAALCGKTGAAASSTKVCGRGSRLLRHSRAR